MKTSKKPFQIIMFQAFLNEFADHSSFVWKMIMRQVFNAINKKVDKENQVLIDLILKSRDYEEFEKLVNNKLSKGEMDTIVEKVAKQYFRSYSLIHGR